jgi:hypothetical protein
MKKFASKKSDVIKFPGNFAGEKMAEAAEKRPSKTLKKSVKKNKPGSR